MIRKAVIPAAGLGTRMLPLTKTQPKEMLPLGGKPCIQYIVEELALAGIKEILFITGSNKRALEDYFDKNSTLNQMLFASGQTQSLETLDYENMDVQYFYTRQSDPKGLGDAIAHARNFVNGEPFVIALGDSVIHSKQKPFFLQRMMDAFDQNQEAFVVGTREVAWEDVSKYGIVKPKGEVSYPCYEMETVIEKPSSSTSPSNLAFSARYIMKPEIFDALERTRPGKGGEIQLTDAMAILLKEGMTGLGVNINENEKRYDIGNMASYYQAFVDFAFEDERYGYQLKQHMIKQLKL